MSALESFEKIKLIADEVIAQADGAVDAVVLKQDWDDYNDETYERQTFAVRFEKDGREADDALLDGVKAVRRLERTAEGLLCALFADLGLSANGYAEEGQHALSVRVTPTGHRVAVRSDGGSCVSGTIDAVIRRFDPDSNPAAPSL